MQSPREIVAADDPPKLVLTDTERYETLGRLTFGVAHDFNNLLTSLRGYAELLLEGLPDDSPLHRYAERVHRSTIRAAALTHQLVALGHESDGHAIAIELRAYLRHKAPLFSRLLGERVQFLLELPEEPGTTGIAFDPALLDQLVFNLTLRAREQLQNGGVVLLTLTEADGACKLAWRYGPASAATPHDVVAKIVASQRGELFVRQLMDDATVVVTLPLVALPQAAAAGPRTVLLVQADVALAELHVAALAGHHVLVAHDAAQALAQKAPYDLAVIDNVLADASGTALARRLLELRPDTRVVLLQDPFDPAPDELVCEVLTKPVANETLRTIVAIR